MQEPAGSHADVLHVPERALLAFREALGRGTEKRMLTEQGKQHFIFVGGVYLTAITFQPSRGAEGRGKFDASVTFDTDAKPYVFAAAHIASMLQLFGGELAEIRYQYGQQVHRVIVELHGTIGFELE